MAATPLFVQALSFAAHKHRKQVRKDAAATPYINHPIALVQVLVGQDVHDEVVLIAALLHDTVEDTDTTLEEITTLFGADVAAIVAQMTDDKSLPKAERKRLQIEHAHLALREAKLVKLADKICNTYDLLHSSPDEWSLERKHAYFDWAAAVVAGLRGTHVGLEAMFDEIMARRSELR
jgi:GTP diphosphokinase / guanosine-3',5'-bis(diphosphate) 3'-diphosphatase